MFIILIFQKKDGQTKGSPDGGTYRSSTKVFRWETVINYSNIGHSTAGSEGPEVVKHQVSTTQVVQLRADVFTPGQLVARARPGPPRHSRRSRASSRGSFVL